MAKADQAEPNKVADFIYKSVENLKGIKSQRDIAREAGYTNPNIISMFKTGETKIPLDKVPNLARALEIDPGFLFRLALEQYWPNHADVIAQIFGGTYTKNEREIIQFVRNTSKGTDPALTDDAKEALQLVFGVADTGDTN